MLTYTVKVKSIGTFWYKEGTNILHREDGPAVEYTDGSKEWWVNEKLHREDGPATEYADGTKEWWLNGKRMTEQEFNQRTRKDSCDGKIVEIEGRKYRLTSVE